MVFYFSGTGNSLFVAKSLSQVHQIEAISIAKELEKPLSDLTYAFKKDDLLGFVFPIHAWAPPKIVLDFISKLTLSGDKPHIFSIATCGGEEGLSNEIIKKTLKKKNLWLDACFSLIMPNNYLLGIDVDSKKIEEQKLNQSTQRLEIIHQLLSDRKKDVSDIQKGSFPRFKSFVINPLFNRFSIKTKSFYATDRCDQCGICEQVCPIHTIIVNDKPFWSKSCTHCLACINSCPQKAIEYGKSTKDRPRYLHPDRKQALWYENQHF